MTKTMTATPPDTAVFEAATTLADSMQASAVWREFVSAQEAAKADEQFTWMLVRQNELAAMQNRAQGRGEGLDGKSLVELIALRDRIQKHGLYLRQQEAGSAVLALLQRVNEKISEALGLDFASNAAPRRGGCCG